MLLAGHLLRASIRVARSAVAAAVDRRRRPRRVLVLLRREAGVTGSPVREPHWVSAALVSLVAAAVPSAHPSKSKEDASVQKKQNWPFKSVRPTAPAAAAAR